MAISMFYTLVMMQRNTWIKCGVLLLTCVTIWFTFIHFQEVKIDENVEKFFRVDKYTKDIADPKKAEDKAKNEEKLVKAKANALN